MVCKWEIIDLIEQSVWDGFLSPSEARTMQESLDGPDMDQVAMAALERKLEGLAGEARKEGK
jgi:hypothetical protein